MPGIEITTGGAGPMIGPFDLTTWLILAVVGVIILIILWQYIKDSIIGKILIVWWNVVSTIWGFIFKILGLSGFTTSDPRMGKYAGMKVQMPPESPSEPLVSVN